jgi:hypothetical protein
MVVWLASYPRSGNTFVRAILMQVFALSTHELYEWPLEVADTEFNRTIGAHPGSEPGLPREQWPQWLADRHSDESAWIVKTHEQPVEDYPAIYVVRDGRDALVSHAHFVLEFDRRIPRDEQPPLFRETLEMLIEQDISFGGWSRHVHHWTKRTTPTVTLRFEDVVSQPVESVRSALDALGCPAETVGHGRVPTFEELRRMHDGFFRRGESGSWRDEMPADLHERFWVRHGETMRALGYRDGDPLLQ